MSPVKVPLKAKNYKKRDASTSGFESLTVFTGAGEENKDTTAKALQKAGYSMDTIRQTTGHFQDITGNWKQEKQLTIANTHQTVRTTEGDTVEASAIAKVSGYKDVPIIEYAKRTNVYGSFVPNSSSRNIDAHIEFNQTPPRRGRARQTLTHEVQHYIQEKDKTQNFDTNPPKIIDDSFLTFKREPETRSRFQQYRDQFIEVEARAAEDRALMSDEERFDTAPATQRTIPHGAEIARVTLAKNFPSLDTDKLMGYEAPFPGVQKRKK